MIRKNRTIIAVDLDYFYAQCEEVRNPSMKKKPLVICVYSGRTSESGAVSTSNYLARKLGVKSGMPIALAKRVLRNEPEAAFLPMDRDYYEAISERIMEILHSHSDKFEQVSVDEAFIDVTEMTKGDFHLAETEARKVKNEIFDGTGLTCSVGIAPNKLLAKLAADSKKPNGLTLINPEDVSTFLDPLPVAKLLGIGPKTENKMEELGIKTIGDLAIFDPVVLSEEFGKNLGPQLQRAARGIDEEEVHEREPEQFSRIVTLKEDKDEFDFVDTIRPLAHDISERLVTSRHLCKSVGIIVITKELKAKSRAKALEVETDSESVILSTASNLFASYFKENPDVLARRVGIRISGLSKTKNAESETNSTLTRYFG